MPEAKPKQTLPYEVLPHQRHLYPGHRQWIAFYDASGSQADKARDPILVAGLIGRSHRWRRFDDNWKAVLAEFGVRLCTCGILVFFTGPFSQGWQGERDKQAAFIEALGRTIKHRVNKVFTAYIPQRVYHEVDRGYQMTEVLGGTCSLAASLCAGMIVDWLPQRESGASLLNIFADGDAGQHGFRKAAELARVIPNFWPTRHPIAGEYFAPFQAADFVAYEFRTGSYAEMGQRGRDRSAPLCSF